MDFLKLNDDCFFKGKLKRRVAVALLVDALRDIPIPALVDKSGHPLRSVGWGAVIAEAACYDSTQDVANAAYEGRKILIRASDVPINENLT